MSGPGPMSDRRFLVVVVALLSAALGAAVLVLALVGLRDPVARIGETYEPVDVTRELIVLMSVGALLLAGGLVVALRVVRAQLRA